MSQELVFDHYPLPRADHPQGWTLVTVGEIARLVASGFPTGEHNQERRGIAHIRPMNIDREGRLDLGVVKYVEGDAPRRLAYGDVLFNNTNSPELIGKSAPILIETELAYSNHMTRICLEDGLNSTFIARQLHYLWMTGYFRHRCVNHVNQASISAGPLADTVPLLLPPAAEQERIADTLDELLSDLDAGVVALHRVRAKLDLYRASVLKEAVAGSLTAAWRAQHPAGEPASALLESILVERRCQWEEEQLAKVRAKGVEPPRNWKQRYKAASVPDTANLHALPNRWCWATVEQAGAIRLGRQRAPQHHHGPHMRPYLRVANVFEDRLDLTDVKEMNFTPAEFATYALRRGDVLLNEGQTPDLVGRPAMYRDEIPGCCYQKTLLRFRARSSVNPHFALVVFRSYLRNGRFKKGANITTNIAHLAAERFLPIEFPLPPLAEQEAIVEAVEDQLSVVDHVEADVNAKLKAAQSLRQAILRHAFSGKLVPQDPSDEPASEVLKRIAAERSERLSNATKARPRSSARRRGAVDARA